MNKEQRTVNGNCYLIKLNFPFVLFVWFVVNFFFAMQLFAQEKPGTNFSVAALGEASAYGWKGAAYGGGAAVGFGEGGALGLRFLFSVDNDKISIMDINVFARLYVLGPKEYSGPFVQLNAGPVIYMDIAEKPDRPGYGNISAGVSTGWRFMIGRHFFIEPAVRLGYPYLVGGGLSLGFR